MKMMLSDQPARELISSAGLDQTLFVQAGAGTGKTTQLVSRIVNTVLNNDVRLSSPVSPFRSCNPTRVWEG